MGDIERAVPTENDPLNTGRSSSSSSSSSSSEPNSARPHHHHHHHHRNHKNQNVSVFGIIGVALTVCLFFFGSYMYIASSNPGGSSTRKYAQNVMIEKEIMLFGDSLVGVPDTEYHLGESLEKEIEKAHPDYDAVISISFGNGDTASDLSSRVDGEVLNRKSTPNAPNAIIISLDSDAVDVDEEDNAHQARSRYAEKLDALLGKVKNKINYVALSGPSLKGEKKDEEEDKKLDAYEEINQKLAKKHDVAYINLREKFLAEESGYDSAAGNSTKDEHPKMKSEEIIEKAFKDQILSWKGLFSGPTTRVNNFHAPSSLKTLIESLKAQHSHAECVEEAGEQKCEKLEKAMKAANELHMNTVKMENGEEIALEDEENSETDPKAEEDVEEAIEMDRETQGTFKNVDYQKVKERVKENEEAASEELAKLKKDKKKNSKKLKSAK